MFADKQDYYWNFNILNTEYNYYNWTLPSIVLESTTVVCRDENVNIIILNQNQK